MNALLLVFWLSARAQASDPVRVTLAVDPTGAVRVVDPDAVPSDLVDTLQRLRFAPSEAEWTVDVVLDPVVVPPGQAVDTDPVAPLDPGGIEEVVVVAHTDAEVLERSAQAVTVVETEQAQRQSSDLGEVVARTQGVGVRRSGGLGSTTRFSLNGLTDDQVRFFLDGVPLELAGYSLGISNVPVDLVERIEVYQGVVPVRFGADALGGAVNLVSEGGPAGIGGSVSYQGGSFDTHRLAAHVRARARFGGFVRAAAYLDAARNDYTVDVEVPDVKGRLSPAEVRRFHDAYRAEGGSIEVGLAERPWADLLSVRAFASSVGQQIQHNIVMTVPYGEAYYTVDTAGATARYRQSLTDAVEVDALVGYTATTTAYRDLSDCVYDWFGQCVRDRAVPGEISSPATDQLVWDDAGVARLRLGWSPNDTHGFTLSVAPTVFSRTGDDLLDDGVGRDPLSSRRDVNQVVSGLEHELDLFDNHVENLAFVKHYYQGVRSEEPLPGGGFRDLDRNVDHFGVGDGLRVALGPSAWVKASYEWATRLPTPEEIFGDAVLVLDNLELLPETSHNANLGFTVDRVGPRVGEVRLEGLGFLRESRDLIVLLGNDRTFSYFNVYGSRSAGLEGAAGWTSPGDWFALDANATWLSLRNTSAEGAFGDFVGDRIPNRPWLFVNTTLTVGASGVATPDDRLTVDLYSRYVHPFFRGWESVGLLEFKQVVPAQLSHTVAATWSVDTDKARVSASTEVQNVTDAKLYDFFGVQRPGRAVFGKVSVAW